MTDIAGERKKLADQGLGFVRREAWGARQSYTSDRDCEVPARALFLHISVTNLRANEHQGMQEIEAIGESRFGIGCSYNAAVFPSGRLYEAQPLTRRGAHTVNNFERATCPDHGGSLNAPGWNNNVNARALVLPQNVSDAVTDAQIDSAARWAAAQVRSGLAVRGVRWHGHRCVTAKDCPGSKGFARIPQLQRLTDQYVAAGLRAPDPEDWLMALDAETRAQLKELARLGALEALSTDRDIMDYVDGLYKDPDGKMSAWDAVQHSAAQSIAAVQTATQARDTAQRAEVAAQTAVAAAARIEVAVAQVLAALKPSTGV